MSESKANKAIKEIKEVLAKYGFDLEAKNIKPKLSEEELTFKKIKRLFGILSNFNPNDIEVNKSKFGGVLSVLGIRSEKKFDIAKSCEKISAILNSEKIDETNAKQKIEEITDFLNK